MEVKAEENGSLPHHRATIGECAPKRMPHRKSAVSSRDIGYSVMATHPHLSSVVPDVKPSPMHGKNMGLLAASLASSPPPGHGDRGLRFSQLPASLISSGCCFRHTSGMWKHEKTEPLASPRTGNSGGPPQLHL